ncbi:hypothetical protein Hanom_Chr11g01006241 [Helianthus anomalus]
MVSKWLQFLPPFYFWWQFMEKIRKNMKNKKIFVNCDHVIGGNMKIQIDGLIFNESARLGSPNNCLPKF